MGATCSTGIENPRRRGRHRASSASTSSYEDSYKSLNEALDHGGSGQPAAGSTCAGSNPRDCARTSLERQLGGVRRHPRARRFRQARHRGDAARRSATPATRRGSLLRHLPGHAVRGDRIRPQCLRPGQAAQLASSIRPRRIRVFYLLRDCSGSRSWAATCGWAPSRAACEEDSLAHRIYGSEEISERHRHRYEFNPRISRRCLRSQGMRITGNSPDRNFVEIVELPDHPWFLGCQFHPEFKSKPLEPAPAVRRFHRRRPRPQTGEGPGAGCRRRKHRAAGLTGRSFRLTSAACHPIALNGRRRRGSNSAVECQLPKLDVAGSIPVSRSTGFSGPSESDAPDTSRSCCDAPSRDRRRTQASEHPGEKASRTARTGTA